MAELKYRTWHKEPKEMIYSAIVSEVINQFTGLKDKNGTEIFEGDILEDVSGMSSRSKYKVFVVKDSLKTPYTKGNQGNYSDCGEEYRTSGFCMMSFDLVPDHIEKGKFIHTRDNLNTIIASRSVVVGNIYENPELIPSQTTPPLKTAHDDGR